MNKPKQRSIAVLGAAVTCMILSFLGALMHLVSVQWLDISDLPGYLLLSAVYSLFIASLSLPSLMLLRNDKRLKKVIVALSLGTLAGLIWTTYTALMLGIQIRSTGFPLIFLWMVGGIGGIFVALTLGSRRLLDEQQSVPISRLKAFLLLLTVPIAYIAGTTLLLYLLIGTSISFTNSAIYLIPQGYEGPVLVIYNQTNGQPAEYQGNARVYEIPANGLLLTQFSPNYNAVHYEFW